MGRWGGGRIKNVASEQIFLQLTSTKSSNNSCCHCHHHHYQCCPPKAICTHIYPLQVAIGLWSGHHSIVGVDDGHDVHAQQLPQGAVQVLPLVVVVEIQICHQDLTTQTGDRNKKAESGHNLRLTSMLIMY